jgi:hypothetical protein
MFMCGLTKNRSHYLKRQKIFELSFILFYRLQNILFLTLCTQSCMLIRLKTLLKIISRKSVATLLCIRKNDSYWDPIRNNFTSANIINEHG